MNFRNPFFPRHAHVFKGGGGGSSQPSQSLVTPAAVQPPAEDLTARLNEQEAKYNQAITDQQKRYDEALNTQQTRTNDALATQQKGYAEQISLLSQKSEAAALAPPVSDRVTEVKQAEREAKRSAKRRRGLFTTQRAGETGGYQGGQARSLLGQAAL